MHRLRFIYKAIYPAQYCKTRICATNLQQPFEQKINLIKPQCSSLDGSTGSSSASPHEMQYYLRIKDIFLKRQPAPIENYTECQAIGGKHCESSIKRLLHIQKNIRALEGLLCCRKSEGSDEIPIDSKALPNTSNVVNNNNTNNDNVSQKAASDDKQCPSDIEAAIRNRIKEILLKEMFANEIFRQEVLALRIGERSYRTNKRSLKNKSRLRKSNKKSKKPLKRRLFKTNEFDDDIEPKK